MENFESIKLPHISDAREILVENPELHDFDGRLDTLPYQPEDDPVEYFDGVRAAGPLYVYEDGFGLSEYRTVTRETTERTRKAFELVIDGCEVDVNPDDTAEERGSADEFQPSFQ
jgi:hypothetical protein